MLKGLGKDIFIYLIGTLAQRAVSFFLLPLYTKTLSVSDYGLVETIMITIQVLVFLMDIGMSRSMLRYYARYQNDSNQLSAMFTTALTIMTLSMVTFLGIGLVFSEPLAAMIFGDPEYSDIFVWTLVISLFSTWLQWIYILFRAQLKSVRYVVVSIVNLVALTALNILFVRFMDMGVEGVLLAEGLVCLLISLFFMPGILRLAEGKYRLSLPMAKQLLNFGFPLIFAMSGMMIISSLDRYFIVHYGGLEDVGIYSLAARIAAMLMMVIVTPFQLAWGPYLFQKEKEDISVLVSKTFTYLVLLLALVASVFLIFSREIVLVLSSPQFLEAVEVIPYMLVSVVLVALYYWAGGLVNLAEQTWKLGVIVFIAGMLNIAFNFLLTPEYGWQGAAWSNVLARGIATLFTMIIALKYKPIMFERKRLFFIGGLSLVLWVMYFLVLDEQAGILGLIYKIVITLIALGLIVKFFPTDREREQIFVAVSGFRKQFMRLVSKHPG
jgi:O-antigen/teichoic acid export membrane protein